MTTALKKFGQTERLTTRIKQLIRNYTRGLGLLKEFLQNADDAGATRVDVWIDWTDRRDRPAHMPDTRMQDFGGPALLIANDRGFTARDIDAIQRIGEGSKALTGTKTGRFGLGFNTAYNITDHPSFITGDTIYCFDPHASAVTEHGTGESWPLQRAWHEFPAWPALFTVAGLTPGTHHHPGTIFRLPLRDTAQAARSEISDKPFTRTDIEDILRAAGKQTASLLLFARHLRTLTITEVTRDGCRNRLRVETRNADEVRDALRPLLDAQGDDLADSIRRWRAAPSLMPPLAAWRHHLEISIDDAAPRHEQWQVSAGLVRGADDGLLTHALTMIEKLAESAVPWVGAAARITAAGPSRGSTVQGALHCTFSLPPAVHLPVHLNGYFDLDDSRQRLTLATDGAGESQRIRGGWNRALLADGCARAWIHLLERLASSDVEGLYELWPDPTHAHDPLTKAMVDRFYELARAAPLIRVRERGALRWTTSAELHILPAQASKDLQDAWMADDHAQPDPPLPAHIRRGLAPAELTPAELRTMLRDTPAFTGPHTAAPRASLRRPEWIEAILAFCCIDKPLDLADLPLALADDHSLRSFGPANKKRIFLPDKAVQALFPDHRSLFLAPRLAKHVAEVKSANLLTITPTHVVDLLQYVVGVDARPWQADAKHPPNAGWLARLFEYFAAHRLDATTSTALRTRAILPGHDGSLHPSAEQPCLLNATDAPPTLLARLRRIGVVTIVAPPVVATAFAALLPRHPNLVAAINGASVVESLAARPEALAKLDRGAAVDLLDWLAQATLTDGERKLLARLPLLPTNAGQRSATDRDIYIPAGFRPPPLGLTIDLVDVPSSCARLVQQLGVAILQPLTFIEKQLLPALASLSPEHRVKAWAWLRDELPRISQDLDTAVATRLREAIAEVPAFPAADGSLQPVHALYDPDSELVREVLGEHAAVPDPNVIRDHRGRWLDLLVDLGIARQPRLPDILRHLRTLSAAGLTASAAIAQIFRYLDKHWATLAEHEVPGSSRKLSRWLAELAWLPPQLQPAPGFVAPEARLYRPNELYSDLALVGSQAPVCAWSGESKMLEVLGLRRDPPPALVLRHLEHLLDTLPDADGLERHLKAFPPIYRYLDRLHQKQGRRVDPDEPALLARLRDRPCIWDVPRRRAWLPSHVFLDEVRRLEPLRTSLPMRVPAGAVLYLGGKQHPEADDHRQWLHDLAAVTSEPLTAEQRLHVLYVLKHVGDPADIDDIPLPCSDGRLRPASTVFVDDAPWLKERPADLYYVDPAVPLALITGLNLQGIGDALQERLQGVESGGVSPAAIQACVTLQTRLRAPEFTAGLLRLVRHTHGPDAAPDLAPVARLTLRPVARLRTSFVLRGRELSSGDARHFFQKSDTTLMLVGHEANRLVPPIARAIQQMLGVNLQIADTGPVQNILLCDQACIAEVLNDDHIRDLHYEEFLDDDIDDTDADNVDADNGDDDTDDIDGTDGTDADNVDDTADKTTPKASPLQDRVTQSGHARPPSTALAPARPPQMPPIPHDKFKSQLARLADELMARETGLTSPAPRTRDDPGLSIPRSGAGFHPAVGGIQPALQSRVVQGEVPEQITREVEEQALSFVMAWEVSEDRDPERMPKDHPGYNVISRDPATRAILRFIEVKGTRRDWRDQPVRITPFQVADALQEPARSWLYIVERLTGTPRVRRIPAFVTHIVGFTIDAESWAPLCESAPPPTQPREGHRLHDRNGIVGTIREIQQGGALVLLTVERPDGTLKKIPFRASEHTLEEDDDGEDVP